MTSKSNKINKELNLSAVKQWTVIIGICLFFTGLVLTGYIGSFKFYTTLMCLLGIGMSSIFFIPKFSRNLRLFGNVLIYSILVLLSVFVLFLIVLRHPVSFDATAQKLYSLNPITQDFLNRIDSDIRITAFVAGNAKEETQRLLNEFSRYSSHITSRVLNPFQDYSVSRQYGDVTQGDIFIESVTTGTETADTAKPSLVAVNKATEESITNGIIQLIRGKEITLYFLTGHGELSIESSKNYAAITATRSSMNDLEWLVKQLKRNRIKVNSLNITQRARIPSDASAIICVGPKQDFSGSECVALHDYLEDGGRALFCLSPELPQITPSLDNLRGMLSEFGLEFPQSVIVNVEQDGNDNSVTANRIVVGPAQKHRINQLDPNDPLLFTTARPIEAASYHSPELFIDTVLQTVSKSVTVSAAEYAQGLINRKIPTISFDPASLHPVNLGEAVTAYINGKSEDEATKLIVLGSSEFLSTENITQSAYLLFMNSVNWLTSDTDLITVPSNEIENTPLILTDGQKRFLFILLVILVPTIVGLIGLAYLISRRDS